MKTKELFETYENLTLRNFSNTVGLNYHMVLKNSKKPIAGQIYDPDVVNYDSIDLMVEKKGIDLESFDWVEINSNLTRSSGTVVKDMSEFNVGDKVYLRNNKTTPYNIIYKTETHIVIMLEGTTVPQSWNWSTFGFHGPSKTPRVDQAETETVEQKVETETVEPEKPKRKSRKKTVETEGEE